MGLTALLSLWQYDILFGEKNKVKDVEMDSPVATPSRPAKRAASSNRQAPATIGMDDQLKHGNEMEETTPNARSGGGQKKRSHRSSFQQLLQRDQLGYMPPSMPMFQPGVSG